MKICMKLITFLLLLFNPFVLFAQYFDWIQTYTGSDLARIGETNNITQTVSDSNGNVYFIGYCAFDASIDGQQFLPMTPYGIEGLTSCTIFGKLTRNGELEWSKIIHSNHNSHHCGGSIQMLGDSILYICTSIWVPYTYPREWPTEARHYLYYLDTLMSFFYDGDSIVHNGTFLYDYGRFKMFLPVTSYIAIDKSGNIKEEYWLLVSFLDADGVPYNMSLMNGDENINQACGLVREGLSCVDNDGNIIVARSLSEYFFKYDSLLNKNYYCYINDADLSALRIYVNGKRYFDVPLPDARPSIGLHNYQILKFSPHFDSLLASQFLFEPTLEHLDTICEVQVNDLKCDNDGNIYLVANSDYINLSVTGEANSLKIGGSDSLYLRFHSYDRGEGFFIKYDTLLNPVYLRQFERKSSIGLNGNSGLSSAMWACQFDDDGILTILGGASSMDSAITSCFFDTAEVELNKTFIRINPDNGTVINQAAAISAEQCSFGGGGTYFADFVASGNRLIWQLKYRWYLNFADSLYEKPQEYEWGMGFAVWDYDGNELCFVDYGVNGSGNNGTRSICLVDSVLYLTGMLASGGAQFGDITVPNSGSSQSFIARYVDTAFMHPYVRPGSQQDIQLVVRDGEPVVTVYPNPCAQRVTIDWDGEEPLASAFVTDISGRTYDVNLSAAGQGRYTVDFSSMPPANYLLTLVTASGHRITSRLLKR